MIRGVIWDADGTLLDSMWIWQGAAARYLSGIGVTAEENLSARLYEMNLTESAVYLKNRYQLRQSPDEIVSGVVDTVRRFYEEEVQLKPGVSAFLEGFRNQGIPMTVATSSQREYLEKAFDRLGIASYFSGIYTCYDYNTSKTKPLIFQKASESFHADESEICVMEDAIHAVRTAKSAGYLTVGVYDEASAEFQQEIIRICDVYLPAFDDFSSFFKAAGCL